MTSGLQYMCIALYHFLPKNDAMIQALRENAMALG